MKLGLRPLAVYAVMKELRVAKGDDRPLAVAGARELVPLLARALRAGGEAAAVLEGPSDRAGVLVYVLAHAPTAEDEEALRAATRAGIPIVAVAGGDLVDIPYVLATDVVRVPAGAGFPVEGIARAAARKLGERGSALAARLPVLRPAVCEELIRRFSRQNGLIGAAVFVPGVDFPLLSLNQIRLVLRIAHAHGQEIDAQRAVELAGVVGTGLGFRAVARELLDLVPVAGWALKGGIAYAGTRAIGEAAVRYFEAGAPLAV